MKVLVTGGAGFIGSNFVRRIIDGTYTGFSKVTVLDNLTYAGNRANLPLLSNSDFILGDVCNSELVSELLSRHDTVINFAAESHVDRSISSAQAFVETNLSGTHNVLEAFMANNVKTLIHVSTDEVYGSIQKGSVDELSNLNPNSPYSASKAGSDFLVKSFFTTHKADVRITRCSNNFGRFQFPEKVIPVFINALLNGKKAPIYGNGENVREWLHVSDHCRAIQLVLEKGVSGEIYNIGSGHFLSNIQLANKIIEILGISDSLVQFVTDRKGHDYRYAVNYEKIKKLGYKPLGDFSTDLIDTINWYRNNPNWWPSSD